MLFRSLFQTQVAEMTKDFIGLPKNEDPIINNKAELFAFNEKCATKYLDIVNLLKTLLGTDELIEKTVNYVNHGKRIKKASHKYYKAVIR